jgi:hypothetical protein
MRKLTPRTDAGELCGDPYQVSGAAPAMMDDDQDGDPGGDNVEQGARGGGGAARAGRSAGGDGSPVVQIVDAFLAGATGDADELGQGQSRSEVPSTYSPSRLQRAAGEVIAELHAAKQELAKELEANLKQLKAVLKETQKIAKEMEAVLREAQAKPPEEDKSTGDKQRGNQKQNQQDAWDPPTLKKTKGKKQQDEEDQSDEDENEDDEQDQSQVPKWSPPEDALHPQH